MFLTQHSLAEYLEWLVTSKREICRWRRTSRRRKDVPRVFYGYDSLPTSSDVASGGVVKTQDLQMVFPNTYQEPNLLYLISSALPPYAPRMARKARKAGAIVVLNQNGVAYPAWHGEGWETSNRFMREVLRDADYVFYQSHFCKMGAARFLMDRTSKCEVLYNPVNTELFAPSPLSLPPVPLRLLVAGSHTHFYRVQTAVDTLKLLRKSGVEAILEIAGRCCWRNSVPESEVELMAYIDRQGLANVVAVSGPYTQAIAPSIFGRSHILLHTKYCDPCPRLVVEAMACGLPVIYSASGGTPELVGDKAGIGVLADLDWAADHPPDPSALAECVAQIVAHYDSYSRAARHRAVSMFDVKPWIKRHIEVFSKLLQGESV